MASGRLPAWKGCSTPLGRCRPSLPTSPRIPAPTRPGRTSGRTGANAPRSTRGPSLRLVMPVVGLDPAAVRRTLQSLRRQADRWSLTVVAAEDQIGEVRALVKASTSFRDRRRIRSSAPGGLHGERSWGSGSRPVGVCPGPDLPRRRLGARRGHAAQRRADTVGRGLRGRGRAAGRRQARDRPGSSPTSPPSSSSPAPMSAGLSPWGPPWRTNCPAGGGRRARTRTRVCTGRHRGGRRGDPHPRGPVPPLG